MASRRGRPVIHVLAGVNGAGKSSIGGAAVRAAGGEYFNPDEAARRIRAEAPRLSVAEANSLAWDIGRGLLERAIAERLDVAFETTLGGATIARMLHQALAAGIDVRIWFVGLESPELHIGRVRARVKAGGHNIPEAAVRARYDGSRLNLIGLLPLATEVWVYDNTADADPRHGVAPEPILVLRTVRGKARSHARLEAVPDWAKAIVAAALQRF